MTPANNPNTFTYRKLLRSLQDLMVQDLTAQARLDQIVGPIADAMIADVCSVYLRRNDGSMELCATKGLKAESVHRTRLKSGEGLVGLVADEATPISLSDAPTHARFSYRPETGEDPYQTFLGVPLLRSGRVIGALVVQNQAAKTYYEDDIEALSTIAAFLAGQLPVDDDSAALSEFDLRPTGPEMHVGRVFAQGLAMGQALLHEPHVEPTRHLSDNPEAEEVRLGEALKDLREGLEQLLSGNVQALGGVPYEVLETFHLLSLDNSWERRLREGVRAGLTAEASIEQVRSEHRARMSKAKDGYLRDRLQDLEELDNRLLRHLGGFNTSHSGIAGGAILVARNIGAADLLDYGAEAISAVLLEEGSSAGHPAIIARAMGIPMIGGLKGILSRLEEGDSVIVDARAGQAFVRPEAAMAEGFKARLDQQASQRAEFAQLRDKPSVSLDGVKIGLLLNAGLPQDLDALKATGADGVGLFRTEFQFMLAQSMPRLETQTALYADVIDRAEGRPVVFRTLDLGGDKVAAFMPTEREENPAMGWRALRMGLDRPGLTRYQMRALVRACEGKPLKVMFPLISVLEEFRKARALLEQELGWARFNGRNGPSDVKIGAMIEAPSLAFMAADLAKEADFLSIGTNDLMQFFFAADRGSTKMADRYDLLSLPAMAFMRQIREATKNVSVSICGEHAGRPLEALGLLGLGFEQLSMPAGGIGFIKKMILESEIGPLRAHVSDLLSAGTADIRSALLAYAANKAIPLQ